MWAVRDKMPDPPPLPSPSIPPSEPAPPASVPSPGRRDVPTIRARRGPPPVTPALQLLALFQREGRLVDFLEQDIATFPDADVGAAARVVHEGCRKALRQHGKVTTLRTEEEGASVTVEEGYDPRVVKLVGNVHGKAPFKGTLRHRGWRVDELRVPEPTADHDPAILAPAEVEL